MTVKPDGDIRTAHKNLTTAIHTLAGRQRHTIDRDSTDLHDPKATTHYAFTDPLYTQLRDMIAGAQGTKRGSSARSMPPLWVDAADLLNTIDRTVLSWHPDTGPDDGNPPTLRRLHQLEDKTWRPQDTNHVETMTTQILTWARTGQDLLDPPARKSLPNPCPACDQTVVYRKDSGGDTVRQPALQISQHGCECQHCHAIWGPDYFVHLARVLGYELPEGVLE